MCIRDSGSNSVTGLNQPLIVVVGVPLDNFTGADYNDMWNPSTAVSYTHLEPVQVESDMEKMVILGFLLIIPTQRENLH